MIPGSTSGLGNTSNKLSLVKKFSYRLYFHLPPPGDAATRRSLHLRARREVDRERRRAAARRQLRLLQHRRLQEDRLPQDGPGAGPEPLEHHQERDLLPQ